MSAFGGVELIIVPQIRSQTVASSREGVITGRMACRNGDFLAQIGLSNARPIFMRLEVTIAGLGLPSDSQIGLPGLSNDAMNSAYVRGMPRISMHGGSNIGNSAAIHRPSTIVPAQAQATEISFHRQGCRRCHYAVPTVCLAWQTLPARDPMDLTPHQ